MLSRLDFEVADAAPRVAPNRADVACFVGRVARRPGVRLPSAARAYLRERGWIGGPWALDDARVEALDHLPVAVESWEAFDRLFAWDGRRLREGTDAVAATYLGGAVRSFFARGGRRAVVVRTGDPWPYAGGAERAGARRARLAGLVPSRAPAPRPFDATDPRTWRGVEHLYGLGEVSHVCLPDLADACAVDPGPVPVAAPPPVPPEVFVECSAEEPADPLDRALRAVSAPRLDADGWADWVLTVDAVRDFLARHRRDALLLASLPLPLEGVRSPLPGGARALTDWLAFLREVGVLEAEGSGMEREGTAASALVQLVWPWLRTTRSDDLPERLEPAEGVLAGVLAVNALGRGTFRSAAGTRLPHVAALVPEPDAGLGPDSPSALLAERVCLVGREPDGVVLQSDVTSTPDPAWRAGGVSRLLATLLRAARRVGEAETFAPSGAETWARVRRAVEGLLDGFQRAGALRAAGREPPFEVRCDRSTMSQNDLDNGRLRVDVTVQPAASVERITVSLQLTGGGAGAPLSEVA